MRTMKAAELVLDFDLYPRNNVDSKNVSRIAEARAAGVELPPVVIDKKSKRVVDGFHRVRERLQNDGPDAEIQVVEKSYRNDGDIFLDAMRYNAAHGAALDPCDRVKCTIIADRLQIPTDAVAGALNMPAGRLGQLKVARTATSAGGLMVPLKRTVAHFAGHKLTKRQVEANEKLSGMSQQFYANQLVQLIESDMLDKSDEHLMDRLRHLHTLLDDVLAAA